MLAAKGASNREIADQLGIGQETVKMHCSNAYGKLGGEISVRSLSMASESARRRF
ncbi:response regulator transcription factor [Parasutterella excrementihominis]|uniref:response regulator transcription factor n=1 Tax=Parasutterella excrementihominis TaxID=487175 RepID=UPI003A93F7FA